jgi:hypothetical protein
MEVHIRRVLAGCFPFGALSHIGWLIKHHDPFYYGPAPAWAIWFWYILSGLDFGVWWLMLTRPRAGILAGMALMAVSLMVNWTQFPTFEYGPNPVLWGLTLFGLIMWTVGPWLLYMNAQKKTVANEDCS